MISAPMSYAGSAQRIGRLRRRAKPGAARTAVTAAVVVLILVVWVLVTVWYLVWGIQLVPYRLIRRGARKRKLEALRHRELIGAIEGSAATISAAVAEQAGRPLTEAGGRELVGDVEREAALTELSTHLLAGRLTTDEFEARVAAAHAARIRADLEAARAGLPRMPVAR